MPKIRPVAIGAMLVAVSLALPPSAGADTAVKMKSVHFLTMAQLPPEANGWATLEPGFTFRADPRICMEGALPPQATQVRTFYVRGKPIPIPHAEDPHPLPFRGESSQYVVTARTAVAAKKIVSQTLKRVDSCVEAFTKEIQGSGVS